jgi:DNA mismatch repair protein MutS2
VAERSGTAAQPPSRSAESLSRYAASSIDWPAVRASFAEHAVSALGRRALAELAPRPAADARAALARLAELVVARSPLPLCAVIDAQTLLASARNAHRTLSGGELTDIAAFLRAAGELATWLEVERQHLPACHALAGVPAALVAVRARLEASVDAHGAVRDDASARLGSLRRSVRDLDDEIERAVRVLATRPDLRPYLAEGLAGKVQRRNLRPVLPVRATQLHHVPGLVHDRSTTGETLYVEPQAVVEGGNRLAALRADEEHEVERVLAELSHACFERERELFAQCERWAELELAAIGAAWARANGGRAPLVPGQPGAARGLLLRSFLHPLLLAERAAGRLAEVVPLDLRLGDDFDLLVITGPNTGGKTLALKSAGLAALLARMGLPLACAAGTTVPLYTGVVADIGDEQAIAQSLSTFSAHLKRIRVGLERAGPETLVLLDELGGGTDPDEGAALSEAILEALAKKKAPTLVSTHIGKLKELAYRLARAENACVEFDVETLVPRYRLVIGLPGESRALAIARRLGLDAAIVDRASERVARRDEERHALFEQVRHARAQAEEKRAELDARMGEVAKLSEQAQRLQLEAEGARGRVESEAQRSLEERVAGTRAPLERARALLPQLAKDARAALESALDDLERALGGATMSERRSEFLGALKKNDHVWVTRFKRRLQVLKVDAKRREVVVRMGVREVTVDFDEVSAYEGL